MLIAIEDVAMRNKCYTLADLCVVLSTEVTRNTVYSWARGSTQPSYEHMDMLCHVLECTPNELFINEPYEYKFSRGSAKKGRLKREARLNEQRERREKAVRKQREHNWSVRLASQSVNDGDSSGDIGWDHS